MSVPMPRPRRPRWASGRHVRATGRQWPSATTAPDAEVGGDVDAAGSIRLEVGRTGARFPSAAALRRWEEQDRNESVEAPDGNGRLESTGSSPIQSVARRAGSARAEVGQTGARFPSAALRRRWAAEQQDAAAPDAEQHTEPAQATAPSPRPAPAQPAIIPAEPEPEDTPRGPAAASVRPYILTGGRTQTNLHLGLETLVSVRRTGAVLAGMTDIAHQAVIELCARPTSVAEIAALMAVPLGVARVLVGDLAQSGALFVHRNPMADGVLDAVFLSRVLHGLRRL